MPVVHLGFRCGDSHSLDKVRVGLGCWSSEARPMKGE
jgi:hypothetical protein